MPAPPWFEALPSPSQLGRLGISAEAALTHAFAYVWGPALETEDTVTAVLREATAAGPRDHRVRLRDLPGTGHRLYHDCSCGRWAQCLHAPAVLLDLALSASLREAVVRGADPSPWVAALPALRAAAHRALAAEQIAARWLPVRPRGAAAPAPVEFFLVLPAATGGVPALQSGSLGSDGTAAFELRLRPAGRRALLDPAHVTAASLLPEDRRVVALCTAAGGGRKGFRVSGVDASLVLHLLPGRGARLEGSGEALAFRAEPVTLAIVPARLPRDLLAITVRPPAAGPRTLYGASGGGWAEAAPAAPEHVAALEGRWHTADGAVDIAARDAVLFRGPHAVLWVPAARAFFPVGAGVDLDVAWHLQLAPAVELVEGHAAAIYRTLRRNLRGRALALPPPAALGLPVDDVALVVRLGGAPLGIEARLEAQYDHGTFLVVPGAESEDPRRDPAVEADAAARVAAAGLAWDPAVVAFAASHDAAVRFWTAGAAALRAEGTPALTLVVPAGLARARVAGALRLRLRVGLVRGLLDLSLGVESDGTAADLAAVRAALHRKRRWVALDDGSIAEITATFADLFADADEAAQEPPGDPTVGEREARGRLPVHQLGRVDRWLEAGAAVALDPAVVALRTRLRALGVGAVPAPLPPAFRAVLRPYQAAGVAWMQFLDALGAGGVLADDMGLGKTVMALALLAWRQARDGAAPSLVVCPTSVAGNWLREAAHVAPSLRTVGLHGRSGAARAAVGAALAGADLVVTTYALLRRDVEALAEVPFRYVVLDEAQSIKNAAAATTRAARRLQAGARLALTGTPVENRPLELWSLMEFCNPGMLGTRRSFEARYERPILAGETAEGALRAARLRALVRPFILRRTKREVLADLPPKQEIDLDCLLGTAHRGLYDALATAVRREVDEAARRDRPTPGAPGQKIMVLTALLRLRQMACDPRLLDPALDAGGVVGGKRAVFLERVRELAAAGRRALVFSQFVELLTLWRRDLDRDGIAYEYLDGATTDRDAAVQRFQEGTAPLFLISLKAGGTGLNLTAADTVIHCDPWWNPAVEDQATDRAHRIGQARAVTVYRLVARGTVEERVMTLKARKRDIADALLLGDASALQGLTDDDIALLLGNASSE